MKKSFRVSTIRAVFAFAAMLFVSSVALAGDAIPGVEMGGGKNPGGIIINAKTDSQGKFAFPQSDSGSYNITFPNDTKFMPFILQLNKGNNVTVDGKAWDSTKPITVRASTKITVIARNHMTTISGTITKPDTSK